MKICYLKHACFDRGNAFSIVAIFKVAAFIIDGVLIHLRSVHAKSPRSELSHKDANSGVLADDRLFGNYYLVIADSA
jgi:hypothetical protein